MTDATLRGITLPKSFPSKADPAAIVLGPHVRFTVLTPRLIRMEYSQVDAFEDRASQAFWHRRQPVPAFKNAQRADHLEIETDYLRLRYRITPAGFSANTLSVEVKATGVAWHYGDYDHLNLRGTARTLDGANGEIELEPGLVSQSGWSVVDDSQSLVFNENGWLDLRTPARRGEYSDLYFFGYGHDYTACIQEYCLIAGRVPLLPRFALGNWWSRYWKYRQDELRDLMVEFRQHQVPLSVCIIDMDWHITKTGNGSSGWTGYTWNRELWPDPDGFLAWLHDQGLRTALNLHPAEGVWPHEARYEALAQFMGQDPAEGQPVRFDLADPRFVEGYFKLLHHPMEEAGVDFWWLDWQQGQRMIHSKQPIAEVLDPLWWLNHLHFYDLGRDGTKRPFIFSRWGGLSSHRYPLGFSGDSIVSWATLQFQPYFTANAANVAFGWWSHDIGGHWGGTEEPELYARWVQFGVFSPIFRLHSTANPFHDRRPWGNGPDAFRVARDAMQLRHMFIPYIYSMAWRATEQSIPLITPLYYADPERDEAYHFLTQYYFGSELMVAPFVTPRHPETNLSRQAVWFPEGDWYDFKTGEHLAGNRILNIYGSLDDIPLFARAGAIVPLGPRVGWGGVENPQELTIHIFAGADGAFTLYEDDGASTGYLRGDYALTRLAQTWQNARLTFNIAAVEGNAAHIPDGRAYRLVFKGIRQPDEVELRINGATQGAAATYDETSESLTLGPIRLDPRSALAVSLTTRHDSLLSRRDRRAEICLNMLWSFRLASGAKHALYRALPQLLEQPALLQRFAGGYDAASDAQLMALRSVLER